MSSVFSTVSIAHNAERTKNADNGGQDTKASKGVKKTPDTRLVQLNLQSFPAYVKKKPRFQIDCRKKNPKNK